MGVDDVRDVINISSAEVPDAKVLKMIKRAEVTLELETGAEIDYASARRYFDIFLMENVTVACNIGVTFFYQFFKTPNLRFF